MVGGRGFGDGPCFSGGLFRWVGGIGVGVGVWASDVGGDDIRSKSRLAEGSVGVTNPKYFRSKCCGGDGASSLAVAFSSSFGNALDWANLRSACAKRHCASTASLAKARGDH